MKQTAVEWFVIELKQLNIEVNLEIEKKAVALFEQAKQMEKEQIKNAYLHDMTGGSPYGFEQYYKETFKSENCIMIIDTEISGIESITLTDNPDCGIKGITFKSE